MGVTSDERKEQLSQAQTPPSQMRSLCANGVEYIGLRVDLSNDAWKVQGELGRGAGGVVYFGAMGEMPVAIKRPKIAGLADMDRFHKELLLLSKMDHPNVLSVVGARAYPPDYTLILPLQHNGSLQALLHVKKLRPSFPTMLQLCAQVSNGLAYVHAMGVVHRDVKPANVLLSQDWTATLADFGLAEETAVLAASTQAQVYAGSSPGGSKTQGQRLLPAKRGGGGGSGGFHKEHMVGTVQYLAPEVLSRKVGSPASDVYALGVLMCEAATGVEPYSDRQLPEALAHTVLDASYNQQSLIAAICGEGLRPALPSPCPDAFARLLRRTWDKDAPNRPHASEVAAALEGELQADHNASVGDVTATWVPVGGGSEVECESMEEEGEEEEEEGGGVPCWSVGSYVPVVRAAGAASCGRRGADRMEDEHVVLSPLPVEGEGGGRGHLLGVMDGHRGAECAGYAKERLWPELRRCWARHQTPGAALAEAFRRVDAGFSRWWEGRGEGREPGCTALAALVWGESLWVANAGDCRAVVCRGGRALRVSSDHTADSEPERTRIQAAGGQLAHVGGTWRVGAARLAVTRALGDRDAKRDGVTAEAEVSQLCLGPEDEFVVVACDGVWDVMSDAEAVAVVEATVREPGMAARRLVSEAMERGSGDNLTVIVAYLRPVRSLQQTYSAADPMLTS